MIADIEDNKVNCVVVKDLSRFGRDYIDTGRYLERIFPELNVRFISVTDNIDSMKQAYDMLLPIKIYSTNSMPEIFLIKFKRP